MTSRRRNRCPPARGPPRRRAVQDRMKITRSTESLGRSLRAIIIIWQTSRSSACGPSRSSFASHKFPELAWRRPSASRRLHNWIKETVIYGSWTTSLYVCAHSLYGLSFISSCTYAYWRINLIHFFKLSAIFIYNNSNNNLPANNEATKYDHQLTRTHVFYPVAIGTAVPGTTRRSHYSWGDWKTHHQHHWWSMRRRICFSSCPLHFKGETRFLFEVLSLPANLLQPVIFSFS